ncbi:MAG: ferredoxin [Desulfobacterales bacterium]
MKKPSIEYGDCSHCGGCIEVAPSVFCGSDLGFINVIDPEPGCCYPEDLIDEAIALCPEKCISWENH